MAVQYNYSHAARRSVADAFALWTQGAHETAAHLAGLSAECVLKSILVGLGHAPVAADGQLTRPWLLHIDKLWNQFQSNLTGRSGAVYVGLLPATVPAPFHDWRVEHRYIANAQLSHEDLERWMWTAIVLRELLNEAASRGEAQ
jgi:hypothetical protein